MSRICFPYEPEKLADIDSACEWIEDCGFLLLSYSCRLINGKENVFEKAILALVLLSCIQAFSVGNKRTARITGNVILIANRYCPLSFRSVDTYF